MGGAASVGVENPSFSEADKAKLYTALQAKYEAATKEPDFNRAKVMSELEAEFAQQAKLLMSGAGGEKDATTTSTGGGEGGGAVEGGDNVQLEGGVSEEDAAAQAAEFAKKFGGGADATCTKAAATSDFRKRRLSVGLAAQQPKGGVGTASTGGNRRLSKVLYRSQEIGTDPVIPLPFCDTIVGTYSCHGVEPSYYEDDGVTAKINQDRGCVVYPIPEEDSNQALFAVYDGHGEHGDIVSHFVMHEIQHHIEKNPQLKDDPGQCMKDAYLAVDKALGKAQPMEATFSGTTAVSVFMRDSHLWIANAGDSRAVVATRQADGSLVAHDLSTDHNPDSPTEKARIEASGGFVSPPPEVGLSSRVWLDAAMTQVGLAMARSIGDHAVKGVGVIAEPEITEHDIQPEDKFIILATDGVWEFITSDEAIKLLAEKLEGGANAMQATQSLIETAAARWREVEGDYRDDITAILVKLPCLGQEG